jgi:hypothetical protein
MNARRTMKQNRRVRLALKVLGVVLLLSLVCSKLANSVDLKPKIFPLKISGLPVEIPVHVSFEAHTEGDALVLQVRAQGELKDIQDKALDIARRLPVPRDNCAHDGVNVVVDSVDGASITPSGKTAIVTLSGHVTAWACAHLLNQQVKTHIASDSVRVSIPLEVVVLDQKQIGLKLAGTVLVTTANALTAEAVRLLAGDLNARVSAELSRVLDASDARATIPSLPGLDAAVEQAEFAQEGMNLILRANGTAKMTSAAFNTLLDFMSK